MKDTPKRIEIRNKHLYHVHAGTNVIGCFEHENQERVHAERLIIGST